MKIQRINTYDDIRFNEEVLKQHGAFLIDDKYPCQFLIKDINSAIMYYHDYDNIEEIIEEFRFYTKHISKFYDSDGKLIKNYDDVKLFKVNINNLQPSQFYISSEKMNNIASWAKSNEHFIVPILKNENNLIILDGHTRLYLAKTLNIEEIYAYEDSSDAYIWGFVEEARKRNIHTINDLKLVSSEDYEILWNKFCDDYFNRQADKKYTLVSFGGRKDGNCSTVLSYIKNKYSNDKIKFEQIDALNLCIEFCGNCDYACFKGKCNKADDTEALYKKLINSDLIIMCIPVYGNHLCSRYFAFNERGQAIWKNDEDYKLFLKKTFLIGIGNISNSNLFKDELNLIFDEYNIKNHTLILSSNDYDLSSIRDKLIDNKDCTNLIESFIDKIL